VNEIQEYLRYLVTLTAVLDPFLRPAAWRMRSG